MTDKERINELKKFLGVSLNKIASESGLGSVQILYDITKGKHGISKDVALKIVARYPNINPMWLLTGEGEMQLPDKTQHDQPELSQDGDGNERQQAKAGRDVRQTINSSEAFEKALAAITAQGELVAKSQAQVDELLRQNKEQFNRFMDLLEKSMSKD